ncbi:hypothetical protein WR25_09877 [Diploscapter pachys]|uniref:Uncharacterized protein n=1 Tax=Diploscapter pachys TaxID=2018661 RepID=A0A2A2LH17_9BILA|nr:hypothetical protein WR25_09877 [Diploscapter pachys]
MLGPSGSNNKGEVDVKAGEEINKQAIFSSDTDLDTTQTEPLIEIHPSNSDIYVNSNTMGGMCDYKYLSGEQMKGFDTYKYSCIDNSPLSVYISHPFWNWLVQFYPRSWAPNVLTLLGWGFVMGCFVFEGVLDYDISANSPESPHPIPRWFWLVAALCTFLGHTLDGTDGKQARRIGASGPTGELFDHGLDSWSTVPFTITIFSIFGRGTWSISSLELLCVLISTQVVFFTTHWEKYNTGVMFLSWGYDASQFGLMIVYTIAFIFGHSVFQYKIADEYNLAFIMELGFYTCCFLSLVVSLYNVLRCTNLKQPNLYEGCRPAIPVSILFAVSIFWVLFSPTKVIERDPRMFYMAMGTVFSNITCRLIIAQMSSTKVEIYNTSLVLYAATIVLSLYFPHYELSLLRLSTVAIVLLHVHYGVCVVRQMCAHFKIHALDVSYLAAKKT